MWHPWTTASVKSTACIYFSGNLKNDPMFSFGYGPFAFVGKHFALLEIKVTKIIKKVYVHHWPRMWKILIKCFDYYEIISWFENQSLCVIITLTHYCCTHMLYLIAEISSNILKAILGYQVVCQPSFLLNLQSSTNDSEESSQQSWLSMPENGSECTFSHGLNKLCSDCNLLPSFRGFLRKLNWSFFKGKNSLDNCLRIRNYIKGKLFNMIFHFKSFSVCFPILSLIYKSCI